MRTIGAADIFGLPVSTTHVLSSGVAGTMAANGSGLQMETVRNLAMAWVLTLPAAILLSGPLLAVPHGVLSPCALVEQKGPPAKPGAKFFPLIYGAARIGPRRLPSAKRACRKPARRRADGRQSPGRVAPRPGN